MAVVIAGVAALGLPVFLLTGIVLTASSPIGLVHGTVAWVIAILVPIAYLEGRVLAPEATRWLDLAPGLVLALIACRFHPAAHAGHMAAQAIGLEPDPSGQFLAASLLSGLAICLIGGLLVSLRPTDPATKAVSRHEPRLIDRPD